MDVFVPWFFFFIPPLYLQLVISMSSQSTKCMWASSIVSEKKVVVTSQGCQCKNGIYTNYTSKIFHNKWKWYNSIVAWMHRSTHSSTICYLWYRKKIKYLPNQNLVKMSSFTQFHLFNYQQSYGNFFKVSNNSIDHNSRELQAIIPFQCTNTINNYSLFHIIYLLICCSIFVVYHGCTAYGTGYWVEGNFVSFIQLLEHFIKLLAYIKTSQAAPILLLEQYFERV